MSSSMSSKNPVDGTATVADSDYLADNPQRRCPDLHKLRSLGGGSARVSLDAGLARYVEWYRRTGGGVTAR